MEYIVSNFAWFYLLNRLLVTQTYFKKELYWMLAPKPDRINFCHSTSIDTINNHEIYWVFYFQWTISRVNLVLPLSIFFEFIKKCWSIYVNKVSNVFRYNWKRVLCFSLLNMGFNWKILFFFLETVQTRYNTMYDWKKIKMLCYVRMTSSKMKLLRSVTAQSNLLPSMSFFLGIRDKPGRLIVLKLCLTWKDFQEILLKHGC